MKLLPPPGPGRWLQLGLLGVTLVLLASVLGYRWRQAGPAAPASNVPAQTAAPRQAVKLPQAVRLTELDAVADRSEVGRNPFGFGTKPAPPAPPVTFSAPIAAPPPPPPPVPQGPPPIALKLAGLVVIDASGRTMVTLKDPTSGASFRAFEGEIVDGRYRVVKVGQQSVVLSYVDGSGQRTIPLGG